MKSFLKRVKQSFQNMRCMEKFVGYRRNSQSRISYKSIGPALKQLTPTGHYKPKKDLPVSCSGLSYREINFKPLDFSKFSINGCLSRTCQIFPPFNRSEHGFP